VNALEGIVSDKKEPKLFRVEAAFSLGVLSWDAREREDAAEWYRECTATADRMKSHERNQKFLATQLSADEARVVGIAPTKSGVLVDRVTAQAKSNLQALTAANLTAFPAGRVPTTKHHRSDGSVIESEVRTTRIGICEVANLSKESAEIMFSVGGEKCDNCGKSRQELGLTNLLKCGRCKVTNTNLQA